ncbi:hypothetical protein [Thermococcus sp. LS1]|uniref:hypothetical protein n=1 Tax=Thermococcus sp. LS1 TaxID=1638259 RepID=UPI001F0D534D|nr:hypothetical protein [Thermococcus sp. LS1]
MKLDREANGTFLKLHVAVTLMAYSIFVAWLVTGTVTLGFAFFEVWWMAVVFGVLRNY